MYYDPRMSQYVKCCMGACIIFTFVANFNFLKNPKNNQNKKDIKCSLIENVECTHKERKLGRYEHTTLLFLSHICAAPSSFCEKGSSKSQDQLCFLV